jgi:hypothetical protein
MDMDMDMLMDWSSSMYPSSLGCSSCCCPSIVVPLFVTGVRKKLRLRICLLRRSCLASLIERSPNSRNKERVVFMLVMVRWRDWWWDDDEIDEIIWWWRRTRYYAVWAPKQWGNGDNSRLLGHIFQISMSILTLYEDSVAPNSNLCVFGTFSTITHAWSFVVLIFSRTSPILQCARTRWPGA